MCESSVFVEADLIRVLPKASSADHELVLLDEAVSVVADSAGAGILAELSGVRMELLWH